MSSSDAGAPPPEGWTETSRHPIQIDGFEIHAVTYRTPDGPAIQLEGQNCNLEGELPGLYYPRRP